MLCAAALYLLRSQHRPPGLAPCTLSALHSQETLASAAVRVVHVKCALKGTPTLVLEALFTAWTAPHFQWDSAPPEMDG